LDSQSYPAPNRIRELRETRGLTLAELADRVGTTNQQISHLELGKRQLTVEWLRRLGVALECHPWAIVDAACKPKP
jgi:transcriptional regulator with XRE-family HTH domain